MVSFKSRHSKKMSVQLSWVDSLDKQDMQIFIKVCEKCFSDNNDA